MNGFDAGLLIPLGFLVFVGLAKGLARLLVGMGDLVAAFWLAAYFHQSLALDLSWTSIPGQPLKLISYVLIFLATMLAGGLSPLPANSHRTHNIRIPSRHMLGVCQARTGHNATAGGGNANGLGVRNRLWSYQPSDPIPIAPVRWVGRIRLSPRLRSAASPC